MKHILSAALFLPLFLLPACEPSADTRSHAIAETKPNIDVIKTLTTKGYFGAIKNYADADIASGRKGIYAQSLATLGRTDILAKDGLLRAPRHKCGENLRQASPVSDWLPDAVNNHTLVIINENHSRPRDRAFIQNVLKTLKPLGFTHYAAETFPHNISESKEPFAKYGEGFYTEEPVFGKLLTFAKTEGFTLIAYEQKFDPKSASEESDMLARIEAREKAQTENLMEAVLRDAPTTKMIIHVGHSHVAERPIPHRSGDGETLWMAARLKAASGIDPLTISQTACSTDGNQVVLLTEAENADRNAIPLFTDLAIGHPPQSFTKGRPDWRRKNGEIDVSVPAEWLGNTVPIIVEARPSGQSENSIPADRIAILAEETDIGLLLLPGEYDIQAFTESEVIGKKTIKVEK